MVVVLVDLDPVELEVGLVDMTMVLVEEMVDPVDVWIDDSVGSVVRQAILEVDVLPMLGPVHVHRHKFNMWTSKISWSSTTRTRIFTKVAPAKSAATSVVS